MHGPDDTGTRPDLATGDEVLDSLLIRFRANLDSYQSANYREAQLRQEFLDPLFASLGWDMENRLGYSEAYKEVIHEDAIKVGGATKRLITTRITLDKAEINVRSGRFRNHLRSTFSNGCRGGR